MGMVPERKQEKIAFFETHVQALLTNATAIGTSTAAVTDLQTKTQGARTLYQAQLSAQAAAKLAVQAADQAVEQMAIAGAAVIEQVRAKARMSGDGIYTLAGLPAPATPAAVGNPGEPTQLKVTLNTNGSLDLRFACKNPAGCHGVIYQVYRRVASTGEYHYIGGSGQRSFTDTTVPAGVPSVMYQIQATRSTAVGKVGEFVVNFGVTPTGMTTTVSSANTGTPAKIAA
ncbi:MAG TPA: hypothetical protein VGN72_23095 [Tepidisphaeraceae bacterium]|nr:hypothetical protein [Tepidisphaeraceae bacterium]